MAQITASLVKQLREQTGAGMMDAKKALTENDGDMEAAVDWLRTKGLAKAAKKSGRTAAEGLVAVAVEGGYAVTAGATAYGHCSCSDPDIFSRCLSRPDSRHFVDTQWHTDTVGGTDNRATHLPVYQQLRNTVLSV